MCVCVLIRLRFLQTLTFFPFQLVTLAESLGGYESLAELPYLMTHASIEEKERVALGVTNNLIRLSVGKVVQNFCFFLRTKIRQT